MNYPQIGSKTKFVKVNSDGKLEKGEGTIFGLGLDFNKRLIVHIEVNAQTQEKTNIPLACLNPTDEFIAMYEKGLQEIEEIAGEGNKLVQEIVTAHNKDVEALYTELLGLPVEFESVTISED